MSSLLKVTALKTDTQAKRCDCTLYHAAFAGSNQQLKANSERLTQLNSTQLNCQMS